MKVVILAGGYGSRLAEHTDLKPKPMVEVGEHPILWHVMSIHAAHGFDDFVIACGYKGEIIGSYSAYADPKLMVHLLTYISSGAREKNVSFDDFLEGKG
jgi:NDP-sugar pyrophosphorylase family protein